MIMIVMCCNVIVHTYMINTTLFGVFALYVCAYMHAYVCRQFYLQCVQYQILLAIQVIYVYVLLIRVVLVRLPVLPILCVLYCVHCLFVDVYMCLCELSLLIILCCLSLSLFVCVSLSFFSLAHSVGVHAFLLHVPKFTFSPSISLSTLYPSVLPLFLSLPLTSPSLPPSVSLQLSLFSLPPSPLSSPSPLPLSLCLPLFSPSTLYLPNTRMVTQNRKYYLITFVRYQFKD